MTGVKVMALPQVGLALAESVENAVGDVQQPGAKSEEQRWEEGQVQVHGDGEEPCPESGDGGRVQAKKMPPFCEVGETVRQVLVYCGWSCPAIVVTAELCCSVENSSRRVVSGKENSRSLGFARDDKGEGGDFY